MPQNKHPSRQKMTKDLLKLVEGWESTDREEFIKQLLPLLSDEQLKKVHAWQMILTSSRYSGLEAWCRQIEAWCRQMGNE